MAAVSDPSEIECASAGIPPPEEATCPMNSDFERTPNRRQMQKNYSGDKYMKLMRTINCRWRPSEEGLEARRKATAAGGWGREFRRAAKREMDYPPHMPRRGAPQPHGPGSAAALAVMEPPPATANTESCFSTFLLPHDLHTMGVVDDLTMASKSLPHSRQRYSKIGIRVLLAL